MLHRNFARTANAAALKERFSRLTPDPCRHCLTTAECSCGAEEAKTACKMARDLLPQIREGAMRIRHADLRVAVDQAEARGRAIDLAGLRGAAHVCARTARTEKLHDLVAAFEALEQAAQHAADARPR